MNVRNIFTKGRNTVIAAAIATAPLQSCQRVVRAIDNSENLTTLMRELVNSKHDTFEMTDAQAKNFADSIKKVCAKEALLAKQTTRNVGKFFDEDDTEYIMHEINTPETQKILNKILPKLKERKEDKIFPGTLISLVKSDKEYSDFNMRLITAKQADNKLYSSWDIDDIVSLMNISSVTIETKALANKMLGMKVPGDKFFDILSATSDFNAIAFVKKIDYAKKLLAQQSKSKNPNYDKISKKLYKYFPSLNIS